MYKPRETDDGYDTALDLTRSYLLVPRSSKANLTLDLTQPYSQSRTETYLITSSVLRYDTFGHQ